MPTTALPPRALFNKPHGYLMAAAGVDGVALFLRQDRYEPASLPRQCPIEFRLMTWDESRVLAIALLVRIQRDDLRTHETWINGAEPAGVRMLQTLAEQPQLELHLVTTQVERSLRLPNSVARPAARAVAQLKDRSAWSAAEFAAALDQLNHLYPTAHALWWSRR